MTRTERFKFLQLVGDRKPHDWFNVIFLGVNHLKMKQSNFEKLFKKALSCGLIKKIDNRFTLATKNNSLNSKQGIAYSLTWEQYDYILTDRGDACLREELLEREGESDYTRHFNRSTDGKYGLDRYAPLPKGLTKIEKE